MMTTRLKARKPTGTADGQLTCCVMDPACWMKKKCELAGPGNCNGSCAKDAEPGKDAYTAEELLWLRLR